MCGTSSSVLKDTAGILESLDAALWRIDTFVSLRCLLKCYHQSAANVVSFIAVIIIIIGFIMTELSS